MCRIPSRSVVVLVSLIKVLAGIGGEVRRGEDVGGDLDAVGRQARAVALVEGVILAAPHREVRHDPQRPAAVTHLSKDKDLKTILNSKYRVRAKEHVVGCVKSSLAKTETHVTGNLESYL